MNDVLARAEAASLSIHEKNIELYAKGARQGAAELYGYSALAGREMLLAKALIPNGNHKDSEGGFKAWLEQRFPQIAYCTATRWMRFFEAIQEKGCMMQLFSTSAPKLLSNGELSEKDCDIVLESVPQIMDGKSATAFMRDLKLAKRPEPAGGYRPDLKALRKWLSEHHPDLNNLSLDAVALWDSLPVPVRQDFRKQHKPRLDPKLLAQAKLERGQHLLEDCTNEFDDDAPKKYWTPELREHWKKFLHDRHQYLVALEKSAPKQPKRKAAK